MIPAEAGMLACVSTLSAVGVSDPVSGWVHDAPHDDWDVLPEPHGEPRPVLWVDGARNPVGRAESVGWYELCARFRRPVKVAGEKVDAPGWLPVRMLEGETHRKRANVAALWALVVDFDGHDGLTVPEMLKALRGMRWSWLLHTTWSHSPEQHKARVIFPFAQEVGAEKWAEVWAAGAAWAKDWGGEVDHACKDPSRLYFAPALPAGDSKRAGWFRCEFVNREFMNWRWLVAQHAPPVERVVRRRVALASAGRDVSGLEGEMRRRRAFARAVLDKRVELLRTAQPGKGQVGRNVYAYAGARAAGSLVAAGVLDEAEAWNALASAAEAAGLPAREARRALNNGFTHGKAEAWKF